MTISSPNDDNQNRSTAANPGADGRQQAATGGGNPINNWPKPLAFVFSGGGAFGAVQVGMIRALVQTGIRPDLIVGTSVGALNGAMYAVEPLLAVERLTAIWAEMPRSGVFGGRTRTGMAFSGVRNLLFGSTSGLVRPDKLRALIEENLPVANIEDLRTRMAVVATDALVGRPKLLTQGPAGPVLQASAAIPGVFPPVKIDGCFYIDGGVTANVPVRQAIEFGARSVVILDASPATMPGTLPDSTFGSVVHASMIMLRNQRADAVDDLTGRHPILHLPLVTPPTQSSFDFANSAALIDAGFTASRAFLRDLPALTDTSPTQR
jgi:NTE family protein